jgi:predicted RNA-binding protein with PUA-like domain
MNYWLVKSEPETFSLEDFEAEQVTVWYGVRNYQARNNLKAMQLGDVCLFYQSVTKPGVIATCTVVSEHYPDPKSEQPHNWVAVDLEIGVRFSRKITLAEVKADDFLQGMILLKNSRLSVQPVTKEEFDYIYKWGFQV